MRPALKGETTKNKTSGSVVQQNAYKVNGVGKSTEDLEGYMGRHIDMVIKSSTAEVCLKKT